MKRIALTAVAAVVAMSVPSAAHAAGDSLDGGCFLAATELGSLTSNAATGVLGDLSVTRDGTGVATDATVACWIDVNGGEVTGTRFGYSGFGAQAGVDRVAFTAAPTDVVSVCEQVGYGDGGTTSRCDVVTDAPVPPAVVGNILEDIWNVTDVWSIDPTICPVLQQLHGDYGPVTIGPDGDVYVPDPIGLGIAQLQDCPPYEPPPSDPPVPPQLFLLAPSP